MAPPAFDDDLGLFQCVEDFAIEQLVTELRVEALAVAVLPRATRHDIGGLGADSGNPFAHRLGHELGTVVGSDVTWDAAQDEQIGERVDHVYGPQLPADADRQALPGELVDDVEHAETPSIVGAVLNEVVGPDMVGMLRPKPDARVLVAPEAPALRLLVRNLEPLAPPDPLNPFEVHHPARPAQHRGDPTIAIAAILGSQCDDVGGQRRFIIQGLRDLALRRSMLAESPAR